VQETNLLKAVFSTAASLGAPMFAFVGNWLFAKPWQNIKDVFFGGATETASMVKAVLSLIWFGFLGASSAVSLIKNGIGGLAAIGFFGLIFYSLFLFGRGKNTDDQLQRGTQVLAPPNSRNNLSTELKIGNVTIPVDVEPLHFLFAGGTGTGKSQAINSFLKTLRDRGDKVLVVDSGGEAMARLFRDGDNLLNPLDSRSVKWSPFSELQSTFDCDRLAQSMIPAEDGGKDRQWQLYSQGLVTAVLQRLFEAGGIDATNERFSHVLTVAPAAEIQQMVQGLPASTLFAGVAGGKGEGGMLASVKGIIGAYLPAYRHLAPSTGAEGFSIRKWVQNEGSDWLWLPYRDDQLSSIKPLIACWLGEAVNATLSLRPSAERRLWIVTDELASLGMIASLSDGLTKGRKYGLRVVAGLQSVSQLRQIYGQNGAQTLLSCLSTLLCLRAADSDTAEYFSKAFGEQEILRTDSSENSSGGTTTSVKHVTQKAILASEISGLSQRVGFVRVANQPDRVYATAIPVCDLGKETIEPYRSK
jgi:type IV secretory pathway TraG/TraD family ATPase VirD4